MPIRTAIFSLVDPRGRIDRTGLLVVASVLLALQAAAALSLTRAGVALDHPVVLLLKLAFFWLATVAVAKRLHDLDRSAWTVLKAGVALLLWSVIVSAVLMATLGKPAMQQGEIGFWCSVAATTLPVFLLTLWLHCAPGTPGANRFGPAPGFSNAVQAGHDHHEIDAADGLAVAS